LIGRNPSLSASAKFEPEFPRQGKVAGTAQQNTFFAGQVARHQASNQFSEGAAQINQRNSGNFFNSGRIGKANSLEGSNAHVPPLILHDTQIQSERNDARTIQHDQLNTQQHILRNTQNIRPLQFNQHESVPFVSQVHGVHTTPTIQIQSLPNIRPEIRGAVVQTQNIPLQKQTVQRFPQTVQIQGSPSKPINAGHFQRFENIERLPAPVKAPENVRPVQDFSHNIDTAPRNVQRFPQVQIENQNPGPSQTFPHRQPIQGSLIERQPIQPLLRNAQSSGFSHNGEKTIHGLQSTQRFPEATQLKSELPTIVDQPRVSSKVLSHSSNIIQNEAFDRHRDSFFEKQKFQQTNEVTN